MKVCKDEASRRESKQNGISIEFCMYIYEEGKINEVLRAFFS